MSPASRHSSDLISVVVPVLDEEESLRALYEQIDTVAKQQDYTIELIFVDDGSDDGSWGVIESLAVEDARVRGIRFRRNFGKAAALSVGFSAARGTRIFTMDADLQDDPAEIPKLLARLDGETPRIAAGANSEHDAAMANGESLDPCDVVSGWKRTRHDPWHKVIPSRIFNWMVRVVTGVPLHDHNCGMKCYRSEVLREIRLYGELHRFVPVLAQARGFKVAEVEINHRPRKFGRSKFGMSRMLKGFLDLMTVKFIVGYGKRPQHWLGSVGLLSFGFGAVMLTVLAVWWVLSRNLPGWTPIHLHERAVFFYSLGFLLFGGQLMSVGFLAELLIAHHSHDSDTYSIAAETPERLPDERHHERNAS
ncbi:MAG: glycosyltransferase family 2 protein [Pirellulales bacterium]|nr:glycosyltransferase family 2 protein [Pirellulales bacterium]